jgi:hypothetical membrane protein
MTLLNKKENLNLSSISNFKNIIRTPLMRYLNRNYIINFIRDRGEYFGIVGAISLTISTLISFLLHYSIDPSFNIMSHAVSELGTGSNISSVIFDTGMMISSICSLPLYISFLNYFHKKECSFLLIKITALGSLFTTVGHIIVSFVPFEWTDFDLFLIHGIGAAIHYVAGSIIFILYGLIELLSVKISKILVIISFTIGLFYGIVWIGFIIGFIAGISENSSNHIMQWLSLAGIILWSLLHGIYLIKLKKRISLLAFDLSE